MPNKRIYGCILPCDLKVCKQISQLLFLYKLISNRDFSPKRIGKQGKGPWLGCTQWPEVWKERNKAGDWARSLENREDSSDIEQNQLETPAKQRMPIQGTGWKGRLRFSKLPFFLTQVCVLGSFSERYLRVTQRVLMLPPVKLVVRKRRERKAGGVARRASPAVSLEGKRKCQVAAGK